MLYFIVFIVIKTVFVVRVVQQEINQGSVNDEPNGNQGDIIIMEAVC